MNGKNGLACITPISSLRNGSKKIVIRPLPGLPVVRDLVVDMGQFYKQYEKIKPYLLNDGKNPPAREHLQIAGSNAKSSTDCTNVFSALVARRLARHSGGTRTSSCRSGWSAGGLPFPD
jgi:succinate dehydrogenase/fumarate reductase-like Fe-S protein